ncbi:MAG: DNA-3-methyladenine glycosylase [Ignavibacteria bacterium]
MDTILLEKKLYMKDTITVAQKLLGCLITKETPNYTLSARIVETEAYLGNNDPACHAYRKLTDRNRPMFEYGGISYVYFVYGNYFCFNVVTENKGTGSAVLIRAVEPIEGIHEMRKNRNYPIGDVNLTNGPAKFCMAFDIGRKDNSLDLTEDRIKIFRKKRRDSFTIAVTTRIGIKEGAELPYRFFIKDNAYVTKHRLNKEIIKEIK